MTGFWWSKLAFLVSVLVTIVFPSDEARAISSTTDGSNAKLMKRLSWEFQVLDICVNVAMQNYYEKRIKPSNPIVVQNLTRIVTLNGSETAEDVIRRFIQEVDRFRNPVYLAYFDEQGRGDKLTGLSQDLLCVSSTLNLTYNCAVEYVFRGIFPKKTPPSENLQWKRVYMENIIKAQKNISLWPATIQELRTYATLRELKKTKRELRKLLLQLRKLV